MFPITKNWYKLLENEFNSEKYLKFSEWLNDEYITQTIYPKPENVFNALNIVPYDKFKIVIIGQDPYINEGQAHGLCFSVEKVDAPPSLVNIFKELKSELDCYIPNNGNLTKWAKQGVLLLNSVLTVEKGKSFSHKGKGWEVFTKEVINKISQKQTPVVFLLWGAGARSIVKDIDLSRHHVLTCAHPSPLSAYQGFLGNGHFKKTNDFLKMQGRKEINWQIEDI